MRWFTLILICFFGLTQGAAAFVDSGQKCLVMPGNRVKEKYYADHEGQRIHFCCRSCVKSFKKNPQTYFPSVNEDIKAV